MERGMADLDTFSLKGRGGRRMAGLNGPEAVPVRSVRAQLKKILASEVFVRSERMSRFLRFIVEQTLQGRGGQLKEYLLGVEVFDRSPSYDPRIDPIVR